MTRERNYVTANELAETLGVSTGQAYKIIRRLNNELDKKSNSKIFCKKLKSY